MGLVGVDATYGGIGDKAIPAGAKRRNPNTAKTLVVIAVEMLVPKGFGRIRLRRITDASERQVIPFVKDVVQAGATVHTDGSAAYRSLKDEGYGHQRTVMLGSQTPAHISMPGVHRVAALIQRWLLGTHQGAVQPAKFDHYLDEFVLRCHRRTSASRGMPFYRPREPAGGHAVPVSGWGPWRLRAGRSALRRGAYGGWLGCRVLPWAPRGRSGRSAACRSGLSSRTAISSSR